MANYHSGNEQNWIGNYDSDVHKYIHNDMVNSKNHSIQLDVFNQFRFPQKVPISNCKNSNILDFVARDTIFAVKLILQKIILLENWIGFRDQQSA